MSELELEVREDRAQVRIPGPLAVSVKAALNLRESLLDRGQRICDREFGVVVGMDSENAFEASADVGADLHQTLRHRTAIGIAKTEDVGAR